MSEVDFRCGVARTASAAAGTLAQSHDSGTPDDTCLKPSTNCLHGSPCSPQNHRILRFYGGLCLCEQWLWHRCPDSDMKPYLSDTGQCRSCLRRPVSEPRDPRGEKNRNRQLPSKPKERPSYASTNAPLKTLPPFFRKYSPSALTIASIFERQQPLACMHKYSTYRRCLRPVV